MIVFEGQLSAECKRYVLKKESKLGLISGLITAGIFTVPAIILAVKVHWIFIICVPALLIFSLLTGMPPHQKNHSAIMPSRITININNGTITSESEKFHLEQTVSNVVTVKDMGEWYHIYFGEKVDRLGRFVCQKDLICVGTLNEFEKIFDGKLES